MMDPIAARAEPLAPQVEEEEYELKFALSASQADAFIEASAPWLVTKVYDEALPIAFARTTYLDSPERRYLASSREQVSRRLRIREYAGAPASGAPVRLTGACYLEYKESAGGRRSKARLALPMSVIAKILQHAADASFVSERLAGLGDELAAQVLTQELVGQRLAPHLTTWYRRQSLVDENEDVRITLDTEIAFCPPLGLDDGHGHAPKLPVAASHARMCLLEIKYQSKPPRWLDEVIHGLGAPDRLSKYAMGMRALEDVSRERP